MTKQFFFLFKQRDGFSCVTLCSSMFHCCNSLFVVYSGSGSI
jgi:hypothetical protein